MMKSDIEMEEEKENFQKIKNLAKEAYKLIGQRKYRDAEKRLDDLLQLDPENTYGLVGKGDVLFKTKQFDQAISYYLLCLEKDPSNKFSLMGLMNSYRETGELEKIIEAAEEYRHITMQDASILSRVADVHRKMKNFKESEVFYKSALQVNPDDQYVLVGLGHLFFAEQDYKSAIEWWEKALKKQPGNIKILTEIGNSYRKLKEFPMALDYYTQALEKDERNFFALYGMAETCRASHDFARAVVYWEKILANDPDNKLIINRYADSLRGMGEYDKALKCFDRVIAMDDDYFALMGKAASLKSTGKTTEAKKLYQELLQKFPSDPKPVLELAEIYREEDSDKGIQILKDFQETNPSNQEIAHKLDVLTRHQG